MNETTNRQFLMTRVQAARALNVCTRTVAAYTDKGIIKSVRVGTRHMYTPQELERFASEGTTAAVHA